MMYHKGTKTPRYLKKHAFHFSVPVSERYAMVGESRIMWRNDPIADAWLTYDDERYELETGGFIRLNDDHDNGNPNVEDRNTTGPIESENDLRQVDLLVRDCGLVGEQELTFERANQTYVRAWTSPQKGTRITGFPKSYDRSNPLPRYIYLEGFECGQTTLILKHHYLCGNKTRTDRLKLTVYKIELTEPSFLPLGSPDDPPPTSHDVEYNLTITPPSIPSDVLEEVEFDLYGISMLPGWCCNSSPNVQGYSHDFRFYTSRNPGYSDGGDPTGVKILRQNPAHTETVKVTSRDYGGYAKLKGRIKIAGLWFTAYCSRDASRSYVRVPRDDDQNNISDAWSGNTGNAGDDTDSNPGGANLGDGLSRFEEYRGFLMTAPSLPYDRTDPSTKDLFIYDQHGIGPGNAGALGFTLRWIDNNQWTGTGTRIINPRNDNDQCAIWLENGGANGQGIYGMCTFGTPNGGDHAIVFVQEILNWGGNLANVDKTIAHEIGHDVHIVGDHGSPPDCIMNQGLLVRTTYCSTCLSQRRLH
jgi:hypothetical protein